jgi:hypothetical protein
MLELEIGLDRDADAVLGGDAEAKGHRGEVYVVGLTGWKMAVLGSYSAP